MVGSEGREISFFRRYKENPRAGPCSCAGILRKEEKEKEEWMKKSLHGPYEGLVHRHPGPCSRLTAPFWEHLQLTSNL